MATSYNGWPASDDRNAIDVQPFGDAVGFPFPGGVRADDVTTVLGYVATQLHNRVEPCVSGWCWGYTYKQNVNNPSQLSCHASGTAIDWNAPDHPNGSSGTFTDNQVGTIYTILDEVQGAVNWLEGYDDMHFEICVDAAALADIAQQLPAGGGGETDWFDMATKEELAAVVAEQIAAALPAIAVTVWTKGINEHAANELLAQAANAAQAAADRAAAMPVAVWTQPITDDTDAGKANALLARAAAG